MTKQVLGHIDCPACGTANGMRITHDKNSQPFGYCEADCAQQLRIGGNPRRVASFVKRFPWAGNPPVTGTVTEPTVPKAAPAVPAPAPVAAPAPAPVPAQKPVQKAPAPKAVPVKAPEAPATPWFSTLLRANNG